MGAAASIEGQKPMDASDILASESLEVARGEVTRLRTSLGHLAKKHPGFDVIVIDASDLCHGVDEVSYQRYPTFRRTTYLRITFSCREFLSRPRSLPSPRPNTPPPIDHRPLTIDH
jgi:hypothetical protein